MLPTIHTESRRISTHMKNFKVQMLQIIKKPKTTTSLAKKLNPYYPLNHKPLAHNKKTLHYKH
jgi:hypothetical protein